MITLNKFLGINNVLPEHRIKDAELAVATDVNIGHSGELSRREGYTKTSSVSHRYLHEGAGFTLAVRGGDLVKTTGAVQTLLQASVGAGRMWYCNLPDGRTTFSNGLIHGITDGSTTTGWGIPLPPSIGVLTDVAGQLHPGDYQYAITYVRISDGLEGGPSYSNPLPVPDGGILLTGLPVEAGYRINVYLSSVDGGQMFYAGNTLNDAFSYLGKNDALTMPCRTDFLHPMPVGTVTAYWRGRTLVAQGGVLWASELHRPELCNMRRSFKQFTAPITLIQPVEDGIYIGTEDELAFLTGVEFETLTYAQKVQGRVVLGSGVAVEGEKIKRGDGVGQGQAMICIADHLLVAGFHGGEVLRMTESSYSTAATEVAATLRMVGEIPQYVAIPL